MEDPEDLLITRLTTLGISCDRGLASEFLKDPENRDGVETRFLAKLFSSFKEMRDLKQHASVLEKQLGEVVASTDLAPFVKRTFPSLWRVAGQSSSQFRPEGIHQPATLSLRETTFSLLTDPELPMERRQSNFLLAKIDPKSQLIPFTNEASIVSIIHTLLEEARLWFGQHHLLIQPEYAIAGGRPDLVIVMGMHGIPVGAIEVKVPSLKGPKGEAALMEQEVLHGQLLDYLLLLRQVYGVEHPLGIATTYQSWRFCWLPESEAFVRERLEVRVPTPEELEARISALSLVSRGLTLTGSLEEKLAKVPILGDQPPEDVALSGEEAQQVNEEREANQNISHFSRSLHGTPVIPYNDAELPRYIVSFLHKLSFMTVLPREIRLGWLYPRLGRSLFDWEPLPTLPLPGTFPGANTQYFRLLRELGSGQEGKAWEGTTESGATCAVKIFDRNIQPDEATNRRDEELSIWHQIWGIPSPFKKTLLGRPALVMPLVLTAPSFGPNLPGDLPPVLREATLETLMLLDDKGKQDTDLAWRHVGFYREGEQYKAVLLDSRLDARTETSLSEMKASLGLP